MHDSHAHPSVPSLYFFHVTTNGKRTDHSDGMEFPNKTAAWQEASTSCGEIIREMYGTIDPGCNWLMEVADDTGKTIYRFTFTAEEL